MGTSEDKPDHLINQLEKRARGALHDVPNDVMPKRIDDLLKLFGLLDIRDYLLEGYSRGMKQKVLITSALIHEPPILFLDEPT